MMRIIAAVSGVVWLMCASAAVAADQRTPVLVELFTSEGCNDCPPANELLTRLSREQSVPGAYIVALSEHVDYFNRPWVDPFSSAQFTARQNAYAQVFHLDGVYTPEMVVDGRKEFVGSDATAAAAAVENAGRQPHAVVDMSVTPTADATRDIVHVRVAGLNKAGYVYVAVAEDGLVSHVKRGENAGATLRHSGVVRELIKVSAVKAATGEVNATVNIDSGWNRSKLHAIAFVQDVESGAILGTGITDL